MSEYGWVSLISLTGWLVLVLGSYRAHRVGAGRTVVIGLAWLAIFMFAFGLFTALGA